jgi:large subunit ribosomal protein L21
MYAIIRTGGKQYRVQPGEKVRVEKLDETLGAEFDLQEVLFVGGKETFVGNPTVANARVSVVVVNQAKDAKVLVFKKKRRHSYRRLKGHRQMFTELFVTSITAPNGEMSKADAKPAVIDPAKKAARKAAWVAKLKAQPGNETKKRVVPKKTKVKTAPKKKVAAAGKKTAKKAVKKSAKSVAKKKTKK